MVPKPIIAALNGATAGLGLVVSLYCDLRIAADTAVFTTAFSRRGLIAEHGVSWMLPRLVGLPHAPRPAALGAQDHRRRGPRDRPGRPGAAGRRRSMEGVRAYAQRAGRAGVAALDAGHEAPALGGAVPDPERRRPRWATRRCGRASPPTTSRRAWPTSSRSARPASPAIDQRSRSHPGHRPGRRPGCARKACPSALLEHAPVAHR